MSGHVVHLKPVVIQSLSELERVRLREVAFHLLQQDYDLGCPITIPKDGQKRKKSLRRKFDSLSKEKHKDKEFLPQTFGLPLWQVIANDRANKQRLDGQRDEQKDSGDPVFSILQFAIRRPFRDLSSSNSSLSSSSEAPNENTSPSTPEVAPRTHRRGAMSVDSITDLDDNQSRLLEALQLSLPEEKSGKKGKQRDKRLSLNPIYRQVPRLLDSCCQHLEKYGLQTVGIFRVGSSKKRVRQLREEFDRGAHIHLDEDHSTHDVAGLLKEFLRDMPDPLLTRELYTAFVNTASLNQEEQLSALRSLIYLLPPCNCDTLQRLLYFLSTVAAHAPDTYDKDGQEVTGNKMTSLNLATIFGPNLLHKTKSSDREFSVQSSVRAEESTAIIGVVQKMISSYEALFMVPPDLQNKVLMSLIESDPDVVDHLLRRKASQWSSTELFRSDDGISLDESHSGDSNKASSGDVSPYENNSPMLAVHSPPQSPGDGPCYTPQRCPRAPFVRGFGKEPRTPPGGGVAPPPREVPDGQITMWGAWHTTLRLGHQDHRCQGFHGSSWECGSQSSGETVDGLPGNHNQIELGAAEHRLHHQGAPASGSSCSKERQSHLQPSWDMPPILQGDLSEEAPRQRGVCTSTPYRSSPINRNEGRPPPPYPGFSRATLHQASPSYKPPLGPQGQRPLAAVTQVDTLKPSSLEWQDWQRERWQIWQLLSSDNADTLPETLV